MSANLAAVSSLVPTVLAASQIGSTSSVAVYTVPAGSGAIVKQGSLCNVSGLTVPPTLSSVVGSTTGGTFAAGTYYYKVTATNGVGETIGSNEISVVTTGTTSSAVLTWTAVTGATGYKVYRGTAASAEASLITTTGSGTLTYTDTGSVGTAVSVPTLSTAAGAVSVSLSIVPSGGTADGTHRIINSYNLLANETLTLKDVLGGCCLGSGDAVHVIAAVANVVDVVLTGMVNA